MTARAGQCLCGAVRFTAGKVNDSYAACHCRMCQRWAGGPFLAAGAKDVQFVGAEHLATYRSSEWAERGFCRNCGSNIYYRALDSDGYELCAGTFDVTQGLTMTEEIFVDRKPDGYAMAGDHPRLTEAETIARYKAG